MLAALVLAGLVAACAAPSIDEATDGLDQGPGPETGSAPEAQHPGEDEGSGSADQPGTSAPAAAPAPSSSDGAHAHADQPSNGVTVAPDGRGPPGSFAPVLLRPQPATTVVVELLVQSGAEPRSGNLDHVMSVLRQVTSKTVRLAGPVSVASDSRSWSPDDIRAAADAFGSSPQGGSQAVIRLLFLRGGLADNDRVLGTAVRGDVAAVFMDRVRSTGTPLVGAAAIEDAVTMHEVGHLLGLVDLFLRTGREDPENPGHSRNPESVMYWAVQSTLVVDVLAGGPPRDFDADDLADLAAIRGGAGG